MDNEIRYLTVRARFTMHPTEVSGRNTGIASGFMPNHLFEHPHGRNFWIGEITFDGPAIQPGAEREIVVKFWRIEGIEKYITVGRKWSINEVSQELGEAEILTLIEV